MHLQIGMSKKVQVFPSYRERWQTCFLFHPTPYFIPSRYQCKMSFWYHSFASHSLCLALFSAVRTPARPRHNSIILFISVILKGFGSRNPQSASLTTITSPLISVPEEEERDTKSSAPSYSAAGVGGPGSLKFHFSMNVFLFFARVAFSASWNSLYISWISLALRECFCVLLVICSSGR